MPNLSLLLLLLSNLTRLMCSTQLSADSERKGSSDSGPQHGAESAGDSSRRTHALQMEPDRAVMFLRPPAAPAAFSSIFRGPVRRTETIASRRNGWPAAGVTAQHTTGYSPGYTARHTTGYSPGYTARHPFVGAGLADQTTAVGGDGRWFRFVPVRPATGGATGVAGGGYRRGSIVAVPPTTSPAPNGGWVQLTTASQVSTPSSARAPMHSLAHVLPREHGSIWYRVHTYPGTGTSADSGTAREGGTADLTSIGYHITGYPDRRGTGIRGRYQQGRQSAGLSQTWRGTLPATNTVNSGQQQHLPYQDIYLRRLQEHVLPGYYYRKRHRHPISHFGGAPTYAGYDTSLAGLPGVEDATFLRLPDRTKSVPGLSAVSRPPGEPGSSGHSAGPREQAKRVPAEALCPDHHTCSVSGWRRRDTRSSLSWSERGCMCDASCSRYGDCCPDAAGATAVPGQYSCRPAPALSRQLSPQLPYVTQHWYMRDSCPPGSVERRRCEQPPPAEDDPLSSLPVISRDSGVTYRSFHCAACHRDAARLVFWRVQAVCPGTSQLLTVTEVAAGLRRGAGGGWVVQLPSGAVAPCQLTAQTPAEPHPRPCLPAVFECPSGTTPLLHSLCRNHTAVVYSGSQAYRNLYCLQCAGGGPEVACSAPCRPAELASSGYGGLRVRLELLPGADPRCISTDLWDPFTNRCRSVTCSPGQSLVANRCVVDGQAPTAAAKPILSPVRRPAATVPRPPLSLPTTAQPAPATTKCRSETTTTPSTPPTELLAPVDDLQVITRLLVQTQNDLVRSRDALIQNRDKLIHNRDTSSGETEKARLLQERRGLVSRKNGFLLARGELLKRRQELFDRQGPGGAPSGDSSAPKRRPTRRPYRGSSHPSGLTLAESSYKHHLQPKTEVNRLEQHPNSPYDFGDPDGILSQDDIEDALGFNDLTGASSISSETSTSLAVPPAVFSSDLRDSAGPTEEYFTQPEDPALGTDPDVGAEDAAQRRAETVIRSALPTSSGEERIGPSSDAILLPARPRHRGAGRRAGMWSWERPWPPQGTPRSAITPGLPQTVLDGDETERANQVGAEQSGDSEYSSVQVIYHELDDPNITPKGEAYEPGEATQEIGVSRIWERGDTS